MSSEERQPPIVTRSPHISGRNTPSGISPEHMEQARLDEVARTLAEAKKEKAEIVDALAAQYAKNMELEAERKRLEEAANEPGRSSMDPPRSDLEEQSSR